ncbi:hypothetical protein NEOLEDRAFT_514022 [Neolentinus lepideus HHB14362 ss-1]|uniref:Uncharacterized protein n=1 Tax=Neolentinus lepideus HHB14362 ss-1 TaxID=1314782 RepID=A0A165RGH5_9AGAM|nr:hypothetical protein NEOLEDRAFT_514022 [Neolentinus lepideus HHB14362 ss-1]
MSPRKSLVNAELPICIYEMPCIITLLPVHPLPVLLISVNIYSSPLFPPSSKVPIGWIVGRGRPIGGFLNGTSYTALHPSLSTNNTVYKFHSNAPSRQDPRLFQWESMLHTQSTMWLKISSRCPTVAIRVARLPDSSDQESEALHVPGYMLSSIAC